MPTALCTNYYSSRAHKATLYEVPTHGNNVRSSQRRRLSAGGDAHTLQSWPCTRPKKPCNHSSRSLQNCIGTAEASGRQHAPCILAVVAFAGLLVHVAPGIAPSSEASCCLQPLTNPATQQSTAGSSILSEDCVDNTVYSCAGQHAGIKLATVASTSVMIVCSDYRQHTTTAFQRKGDVCLCEHLCLYKHTAPSKTLTDAANT